MDRAQFIRWNGRAYLACRRSFNIYRFDGGRLLLSAAVLKENKARGWPAGLWHDANGNGRVDEEEITAVPTPAGVRTYHGQNWLDDLSLVAPAQGSPSVWRLAPAGADSHGNPVYKEWTKLLTDPVFAARAAGTADTLHGGNELAETYTSDWMGADGSMADGLYVQARGGRNFQRQRRRAAPDQPVCGGRRGRVALEMARGPQRASGPGAAGGNVWRDESPAAY